MWDCDRFLGQRYEGDQVRLFWWWLLFALGPQLMVLCRSYSCLYTQFISGGLQGPYGILGIEARLPLCKASALLTGLLLGPESFLMHTSSNS